MIRRAIAGSAVVVVLLVGTPKKSKADGSLSSKVLYYIEDKDRIKVVAPTVLFQRETPDGWILRVDGIYNSISGATPTGAPAAPKIVPAAVSASRYSPPSGDGDDDGEENEEEEADDDKAGGETVKAPQTGITSPAKPGLKLNAVTGATSPPSPPPSSGGSSSGSSSKPAAVPAQVSGSSSSEIPLVHFSDERVGFNLGVARRRGRHTPGAQLSYSSETDYISTGFSIQDVIDFNKRNTSLMVGGAYTHDTIQPVNDTPEDSKRTVDLILGLTQVLSPTTLFTLNMSIGQTSGLLSDPYKVVELNGRLVPEVRPDSKDKQVFFVALNQFITPLNGAMDLSLRHYQDGFGVTAETVTVEWLQKLGDHFILAPMIRYYDQGAADFYAVRFTGTPDVYSSDYRISAFTALGYGLTLVWMPTSSFSMDVGVEAYTQEGSDGETPQAVYPSATLFTAGIKWTL